MERLKVAVLGAGGLVAQRLQQRLARHPWFDLAAVAGSARFLGQPLSNAPWVLEEERPVLPDLVVLDVNDPAVVERLVAEGVRKHLVGGPDPRQERGRPIGSLDQPVAPAVMRHARGCPLLVIGALLHIDCPDLRGIRSQLERTQPHGAADRVTTCLTCRMRAPPRPAARQGPRGCRRLRPLRAAATPT